MTFKSWAGLDPKNPIGIFVVTYIVNAIFLFVYVVSQIILVVGTLEDRWPLGDISFGIFFFVIGQVILYVFSDIICDQIQHYLDGLFFATICNLLAVMMVYKVRCPMKYYRLGSANKPLVLGLHYSRRPRILRRCQATQLGSQGGLPRGRQARDCLPGIRIRPVSIPATVHSKLTLLRRRPLSPRPRCTFAYTSHTSFSSIGWSLRRIPASAKDL